MVSPLKYHYTWTSPLRPSGDSVSLPDIIYTNAKSKEEKMYFLYYNFLYNCETHSRQALGLQPGNMGVKHFSKKII